MPPPNTPEEFFEEEYRQRRNSAVAHAARRQHFNLSPHNETDAEDDLEIDFGAHLTGSQSGTDTGAQTPAQPHHHHPPLQRRSSAEQSRTQSHSHSRTSSRSRSRSRSRSSNGLRAGETFFIPAPVVPPDSPVLHEGGSRVTHLGIPGGFFLEHVVIEGVDPESQPHELLDRLEEGEEANRGTQQDDPEELLEEVEMSGPSSHAQPPTAGGDPAQAQAQQEQPARRSRVKMKKMDWWALEYVDPYDENLDCPICRSPLVKPHITTCFHIFCYKCLCKSLEHGDRCPIDRNPLQHFTTSRGRFPACPAPPIISNQLDNLQVRCPNKRCDHISARSLIEHHYKKDCPFTKIVCPDPACGKFVARRESEDGSCLHKAVDCVYCNKLVELADLDDHYDNDCNQKELLCEHCLAAIPRHRHAAHVADCAERRLECKYKPAGCPFASRKKDYGDHDRTCLYGMFMRLDRACRTDIGGLSTVVQDSQDRVRKLEDQLNSGQPAPEGQTREQPPPMPVFTPVLESTVSDLDHGGQSLSLAGPELGGADAGAGRPSVPPSGGVWLSSDHLPAAVGEASQNELHGTNNNSINAAAAAAAAATAAAATTTVEEDDDRMDRIMAYIDVFDAKVENLERYLGEVDARQAQLFMNELGPLRDQMLEMHNTMCHMGMHVRWLMETFKQTAKRSVGLRTTPGGGDEDGGVAATPGAAASGPASPAAPSTPSTRAPAASASGSASGPPPRGPLGRMNLPMRRMADRENPPRL